MKFDEMQWRNQKMKNTVSICDFGAKADGKLQTANIQAAIDHVFLQGGGVVVVPTGVYLTGGIRLRSNITLYIEKNAVLKGVRDPEEYFGYFQN
jgi:polygalacturonase